MPSLCRNALLVVLSLFGLPAQAMSRADDGEAKVWLQKDTLCFGGSEYQSPGLFFHRTLSVDDGQVVIYGIQVVHAQHGEYWGTHRLGNPANDLAIKSDTCIAYGGELPHFEQAHARPLSEGGYSVSLSGGDAERGNRVLLVKNFCLQRIAGRLSVQDARYDKPSAQWRCPGPDSLP